MPSEPVLVIQHIQFDEFVDPFEARLDVYRDDDGATIQVPFDLSGLSRIDGMLVGKWALDVSDITKRLCDLCPVVHHLVGVRAVEDLCGISDIPRTAQLIRELLTAGSTLDNLATKFVAVDRERVRATKRAGKALMRAAGVSSHLPDVTALGGVCVTADKTLASEAEGALEALAETAVIKEVEFLAAPDASDAPDARMDTLDGLDVAAVDADGESAPLGNYLVVVRHHTDTAVRIFPTADWFTCVRESCSGDAAPRSMFDASKKLVKDGCVGQWEDFYRVGPASRQIVVDKRGASPRDAQRQFLADTVARAKWVFADGELLGDYVYDLKAVTATENADFGGYRSGVGMIDGPRGLLVHHYTAGADGIIMDCQIMTPTAQNEPWLARILTEQLCDGGETAGVGKSVWTADPRLPCSSAPAGAITFTMQEHAGISAGNMAADSRGSADVPIEMERTK